ncbi:MAG: WYL domain-containing protein [Bacteroidota bacterium]
MAEMNALQRTLRILQRLTTYDDVTVEELYDLFEGRESARTIQRTMTRIQEANIPLRVRAGAHNRQFYSLDRAFDFIPELLTADETLAAVLLAPFREVFAGTSVGDDIAAVFDKLQQLLPRDSVAVPGAFGDDAAGKDLMLMHQPGRTDLTEKADILRTLFTGILRRQVCRVQYRKKRYALHPYSLLLHNGGLYVIGRVPQYTNYIYLALPRFTKAELTEEVFERDPEYSLKEVLKDSFGIWYEAPVDVRIRFDAAVRGSIEHRVWHASQKLTEETDGTLTLSMRIGPSRELIAWILRWGEFAEVLEPASLRKDVAQIGKAIARRNK